MSEIKVDKISPESGTAFTIGDSGDTFTVPSGATIVNSGTATGFGGGKVLQVVQNTFTGTASHSASATWTELTTSFQGAITPTLSTSKILVMCAVVMQVNANYGWGQVNRLIAGGSDTAIAIGDASGSQNRTSTGNFQGANDSNNNGPWTVVWLDAPSTTLLVTYKMFMLAHETMYINRPVSSTDAINVGNAVSTWTMMEIDDA